jgi:hypothetical protein
LPPIGKRAALAETRVPSRSAEVFLTRVSALPLPEQLLSLVAPLLAIMRLLDRQLAYADETIECLAAHDERVQRLRTVPSVFIGLSRMLVV